MGTTVFLFSFLCKLSIYIEGQCIHVNREFLTERLSTVQIRNSCEKICSLILLKTK